ncbi:uncharacterized protein [Dysidea avara]|uniref:uncharacterized protein isoform X2 n=1 Tax=Dysidea avara TaxID=196820 RepID=UPI0033299305
MEEVNHDVNSVLVTSLYHGGTVSEGDSNNFIVPHIDGESVLTPTHDIHSFGHAEPGSPVSPIPPLLDQHVIVKNEISPTEAVDLPPQTTPYHPPSHHSHTCSVYGHYAHTVVPSTDILPILVTDNKDGMIKSIREQLCLQPFYSELGTPVVTVEDGTTLESTQAEFLSGLVVEPIEEANSSVTPRPSIPAASMIDSHAEDYILSLVENYQNH